MKLTVITLSLLSLIAVSRSADEEYDYDEEPPATPVTPAPSRVPAARLGGLLSSRGRVNVARKGAQTVVTQSTTAKPAEQPIEDEEEEGNEPLDNSQEQEEAQTTTTESSKKVRGGVRPFRSNEDLLAALKRRRAQVGPSGSHSRDASASHAPIESTTSKSKSSSNIRNGSKSTSNLNESRPASRGRFGASRGGKPVQEEVEESQREEVQVKAKSYRRG